MLSFQQAGAFYWSQEVLLVQEVLLDQEVLQKVQQVLNWCKRTKRCKWCNKFKQFPRKSGLGSSSYYSADNWLEMYNTNAGIWWNGNQTGKGWHLYPVSNNDFYIRSGNSSNTALRFTCNNGTARGYVYANSSNQIGFLNHHRHWRFRITEHKNYIVGGHSGTAANNYSPNLYFQEDGVRKWSGNAGTNQGKIEYHSNMFYINAGSNSNT